MRYLILLFALVATPAWAADTKISALGALGETPAATDRIPIVDVSDTTQAASGSTKYVTRANLVGGLQTTLTAGVDYLAPTGSAASLTSFPTLNQNTTGNAATATALAANGANCAAGQAPLGVDASGAVEGCWTPAGGGADPTAATDVSGVWEVQNNVRFNWGNSADFGLSFNNANSRLELYSGANVVGYWDSLGGWYTAANSSANQSLVLYEDTDLGGSKGTLAMPGAGLAADRTWTMPDATGTVALTSDITFPAAGVAVSTGSAWGTSLTAPSGSLAGKIANGTSALGTAEIASGACATVVTTSATGVATTDVVNWGFNGDPTSTTGYSASANGMLTIIAYPSANNVNFRVCNNTSSAITPGAVTLNWVVLR